MCWAFPVLPLLVTTPWITIGSVAELTIVVEAVQNERTKKNFFLPALVIILGLPGILGYWIYQSTYAERGYGEIKSILQNHESDLLKLKRRLLDLREDPIFITLRETEILGSIEYDRSDHEYLKSRHLSDTREFFLEKLIDELYQMQFITVRSRTGRGFSFTYEGSYDDQYSLVFCDNPNLNTCFDTYFSKLVSLKPLKQYWWYVHGIHRNGWDK